MRQKVEEAVELELGGRTGSRNNEEISTIESTKSRRSKKSQVVAQVF